MRSLSLPFCLSLGLWMAHAQPGASVFQKAPPAQDEALRKNVNAFYQTHVDGKTRQAMALVSDESADAFFDMQKPKFMSFELQQINYAKDFQQAAVMILAEREVAVPFGGMQIMKIPMESHWKLAGGQWRWFIPKSDCKTTPFGCVDTTSPAADPKKVDEIKRKIAEMSKGTFAGELGFEKNILEMTNGGEAEVTFKNGMDGYVSLKFLQPFSDPEIELVNAEQQIKPNSTAKMTVRVKKDVKIAKGREIVIPLYVEPFHKLAGLRVMLKP
jgi:hypothetical protein